MKISNIFFLNLRKLKRQSQKALFLIIPVTLLMALSIVISSQINNINEALKQSVFSTISDQYTLINLKVEQEQFDPSSMFKGSSSFEENKFSMLDVENIKTISGVKTVSLQNNLPIQRVNTVDLFEGQTITLSNITTLDSEASPLYTTYEFKYQEGEPIPILLSANSFTYTYQDWQGEETITISMENMGEQERGGGATRMSVEKTEAIEYSKEELIGKEFTISFGGLEGIRDFTTVMDKETRTVTISKLSEGEYNSQLSEREEAISQFWDYEKISTPINYSFVLVGIIEDENSNINYLPSGFADVLMKDLISNEIEARIVNDIPVELLSTDFMGLTYNGDELVYGMGGMLSQIGGRFGGGMAFGGGQQASGGMDFAAYNIPGLVIEIEDDQVQGTLDDVGIYSISNKYAESISIVTNSVMDRSEVVLSLNKMGYAYQELGDLEVFENLENTLERISNLFLTSFIILVSAIVVMTMGKLVSESTREIGIFRAIGMKQEGILKLFVFQAFLFISIGYLVGIGLGLVLNFVSAGIVSGWFDTFVEETVSQSFNVVNTVEVSLFNNINLNSILMYTILLFGISLIVSIIPSVSASRISPVEAIKSE
jgi:ABC-type antimicrobial peptide transport system permease subunit